MTPNTIHNFAVAFDGSFSEVDPIKSDKWLQLASKSSLDLFHSPRWMKVVAETFDVNFRACLLERNNVPEAGVAWSELDDIFGKRRVTLPFSDYSDIVADCPTDRAAVIEYGLSAGIPWTVRSHEADLEPAEGWETSKRHFAHHVIDVSADEEELSSRLSSMARRNTRKAENGGVEIFEATSKEELRAWVDLHIGLRRNKYRLLAQPFSFFENIWDEFIGNDDGFLLLAKHNDQIIAGTVYIVSGDTCYYKFNASHPDGLKLRPNNLLMWQGMLRAKARGLKAVDLGRTSATQQGLLDFKESYAGVRAEMTEYRFSPAGFEPLPVHVENRKVISEITTLLTAPGVPDSVTEEASALLYKYFG